jgi:hypothetical protein
MQRRWFGVFAQILLFALVIWIVATARTRLQDVVVGVSARLPATEAPLRDALR